MKLQEINYKRLAPQGFFDHMASNHVNPQTSKMHVLETASDTSLLMRK